MEQFKRAYGTYYDIVKDHIDKEGWVYTKDIPHMLDAYFEGNTGKEIEFQKSFKNPHWLTKGSRWRPKELSRTIMTKEQTIILPEDDEAAKLVTVTGWVSRDGRYYGNDEILARWAGATHLKCDNCGTPAPKTGYTICRPCRRESEFERWKNLESEEYVGQFVYSKYLDEYFFNEDDLFVRIEDLLVDEEIESIDELMLVNLKPTKYHQIDFDLWIDDLPEYGEIDSELVEKVNELNKFIDTLPPISYRPGNKRIVGININDFRS